MIWLTDAVNGHKVAINPQYIVAIFSIPESTDEGQKQHAGKTAINLTTGSIIVEENELDVVGQLVSK